MARKEIIFTATDGRDSGRQYHITEMPASKAEAWAIRAMLAMGKAGIEVPAELAQQGMAGLYAVVIINLARIPYADALPLLDEMMDCVQFIPGAGVKRDLIEDDIEEVATRVKLRKKIWDLHTDFFPSAEESTSASENPESKNPSLSIKTPRRR